VSGSELVVARTAHADNKSDYFVDGRKSSFGAVTALLKGKGIDLDNNRFLILQVPAGSHGTASMVPSICGLPVHTTHASWVNCLLHHPVLYSAVLTIRHKARTPEC